MSEPVDRSTAWTCLMANVLVLPGLGSILAGRRWSGYLQAVLALLGFALTTAWGVSFAATWIRLQALPEDLGPHALVAISGILLFALSWTWSLLSSLLILRRAAEPSD